MALVIITRIHLDVDPSVESNLYSKLNFRDKLLRYRSSGIV